MNYSDLINGIFEFGGAFFLSFSVLQLVKDKKIRGVHLAPFIFYTLWGFWNLFFYPYNKLTLSFIGGISVVVVNTIWVILAIYYKRKEKYEKLAKI